jgi:hypothetical protein
MSRDGMIAFLVALSADPKLARDWADATETARADAGGGGEDPRKAILDPRRDLDEGEKKALLSGSAAALQDKVFNNQHSSGGRVVVNVTVDPQ